MQIEIPFLYTTLLAFHLVKRYDDRSYIKVSDLFNYRKRLLEKALEDYENDDNPYLVGTDDWEGDIEFEEIDEKDALREMLAENSSLFTLENGILFIDEKLDATQIIKLMLDFDVSHNRFVHYNKELLNILGVYKIFDDMNRIKKFGHQLEQKIEAAYSGVVLSPNLKQLLYSRFLFMLNTCISNKTLVNNYGGVANFDEEGIVIDEDYDYYENSEYTKAGEDYPIDRKLYESSDFYESFMDNLNPIQQNLEDAYQYAIFGRKPIFDLNFHNHFDALYIQNVFDTDRNSEVSDDDEYLTGVEVDSKFACFNFNINDEEFAFYIIYVKKLNDLIDAGRTEYVISRNRLLYLLDDIKYCLFIPENFDVQYEKATMYDGDEDSFIFFSDEAKYFIQDVFEGNAGKTMEKLLFTSTYYQLTQDEDVVKILGEYRENPRYASYSKIILGDQLGYSKVIKPDEKK